ncbi:MAG: ATP-binding protein [Caldilineaceae bacterium]
MSPRLADRVSAGRRRRFIGRIQELQLFEKAVRAAEMPFCLLFVYGPGGVGKTSLLGQFAHLCQQLAIPAYPIDGRNIEASPEAFVGALAQAMGIGPDDPPVEALASQGGRHVILVDTYEMLAPLDAWLRDVFLPQMPEGIIFVTAGHNPPDPAWRVDPGWQPLIQTLPLRNLAPDEGRDFLTQRNVPPEELQAVLDFTHSYPLALSLVADLYDQQQGFHFRPQASPDIVKVLVGRLLQRVPGQTHRTALEACALVRVTTESLLARMTGVDSASDLFAWLRSLSFIDSRPGGIFPHDLARDALITDLRWRNPDWYAELHRRARSYYIDRIEQGQTPEQQLALFDLVFLHRENPVVRPVFEWQASGRVLPDVLHDGDVPALVALVQKQEGAESAQLASHWLTAQPHAAIVFREGDGGLAGFVTFIDLSALKESDLAQDPALASASALLRKTAPLRPGERATYFRHWMAADTYQNVSPTQSLIFINMVRHYLTTPGLAFTFIPCAEPEFWTPVFTYADLVRLPGADFSIDGRRYGVFGHDWRTVPPAQWLELLGEREIALAPELVQPPKPAEQMVVLSQEEFVEAVNAALRGLARPDGLVGNPLLRSRLIIQATADQTTVPERASVLRDWLVEMVEALNAAPKDVKLYRAVYHTYVQPAPTQELAAELLDVPFSSYRRHLRNGMERIAEMLWRREVGASEW